MTTSPIRCKKDIDLLKNYFLFRNEYRNYALFVIGINTALRISDLLKLTWNDVYDFDLKKFRSHILVIEKKTQKKTYIAINKSCIHALTLLIRYLAPINSNEYIFFSGNNRQKHISRNRAYNIIKNAAEHNKINGNISCHSLRKTFGYHAWKQGTPPALIMHIYNHSSLEITKRYLSIDQDDKDALYNSINL